MNTKRSEKSTGSQISATNSMRPTEIHPNGRSKFDRSLLRADNSDPESLKQFFEFKVNLELKKNSEIKFLDRKQFGGEQLKATKESVLLFSSNRMLPEALSSDHRCSKSLRGSVAQNKQTEMRSNDFNSNFKV